MGGVAIALPKKMVITTRPTLSSGFCRFWRSQYAAKTMHELQRIRDGPTLGVLRPTDGRGLRRFLTAWSVAPSDVLGLRSGTTAQLQG